MKINLLYLILILLITMLYCGCAQSYREVKLTNLDYTHSMSKDSVSVGYNAAPLLSGYNTRYMGYLEKHNISVIALKVSNNTKLPVTLDDNNLSIYDGYDDVQTVDLQHVVMNIHQPGLLYMLWSLLYFEIYTIEDGKVTSYVPIPIGFFIGLANTGTSYNADKQFKRQVTQSDLIGKTVQPGEEITGFVGIRGRSNNLTIKYKP